MLEYPFISQLSLDLYYTEDEIYELSYAKEPKNPKIQVSAQTATDTDTGNTLVRFADTSSNCVRFAFKAPFHFSSG